MKNDFLFIDGFELRCRVGTTAEERAFPQILNVSMQLFLPLAPAGKSDSIEKTIDYAALIESVRESCSTGEFNLVERVAEIIAETALRYSLLNSVRVKVSKKVFAGIQGVGACILRVR